VRIDSRVSTLITSVAMIAILIFTRILSTNENEGAASSILHRVGLYL